MWMSTDPGMPVYFAVDLLSTCRIPHTYKPQGSDKEFTVYVAWACIDLTEIADVNDHRNDLYIMTNRG